MTINASGIGKRFNREWIFRKLDFTFMHGSCYAVTGPNGSGKSTLLSVLSGFVPASAGTIEYSSQDTVVAVENVYRETAIAAPYLDLIEEFTLEEHLAFHFRLKPPADSLSIGDMVTRMGLENARNKFIHQFSSGMKQRLKLGMAFYCRKSILLLDEPGTNLDKQGFDWYRGELDRVRANCLTIIGSNNPGEIPPETKVLNILDYK